MNTEETGRIWQSLNNDLRFFVYSRIKDDSVTDDILQDLYIRIHENIDKLKDSSRIRPWVYQITRNLIADHYRKDKQALLASDIRDMLPSSAAATGFMEVAVRDMSEMMDNLPAEYCEALCLTEIEGMSQKEYAKFKGISYSGAKSRVQRGRALLRDMLLRCCHYHFDKYGTVYDIRPKCCCC